MITEFGLFLPAGCFRFNYLGEVLKYSGNIDGALNDKNFGKQTSLDLNSLKSAMVNPFEDDNNDSESYILKR